MGKMQIDELITGTKNPNISSSIADMLGSARPKVYAMLQLLSTRYETEVEVINDHYKIANISIPRNDVVCIDKNLIFKLINVFYQAKHYFLYFIRLCVNLRRQITPRRKIVPQCTRHKVVPH